MGVESLGVEYLAAEAREAGHQADLLFDPSVFGGHLMWDMPSIAKLFDKRPQMLKMILENKPDVAAFSCVTANYVWSLELAREIKKYAPGIHTVFGGVHVTATPERVIREPAVDCLIVSEADILFPLVLSDLEEGRHEQRPGVWRKIEGEISHSEGWMPVDDLDTLPLPAKDLFYKKIPVLEEMYSVMTSRGCPYMCTYCHNSIKNVLPPGSKKVRRRSVENVVSELEEAVKRGRVKAVKFYDDVFPMQMEWMREFAGKYRERVGKPYFCFAHPSMLNEEIIKCLAESGCQCISMGVQSADDGQRRKMFHRNYSNETVRRNVEQIKKSGISVSIDHIVGIPGDTHQMMRDAVKFYAELKPDRLLSYWLSCFPGTEILEMSVEMGELTEEERERIENGDEGSLYGGAGAGAIRLRAFNKYRYLFSLIPILPTKWVISLLNKNPFRFVPGSNLLINLTLFFSAVKRRDLFFMHNLRYLMSRKKVP